MTARIMKMRKSTITPKKNKRPRYLLVGGNPLLAYSQGLGVLGRADSSDEVRKLIDEFYYDACGLMTVIDFETGESIPTDQFGLPLELEDHSVSSPSNNR